MEHWPPTPVPLGGQWAGSWGKASEEWLGLCLQPGPTQCLFSAV